MSTGLRLCPGGKPTLAPSLALSCPTSLALPLPRSLPLSKCSVFSPSHSSVVDPSSPTILHLRLFSPFRALWPYETMLLPKRHVLRLTDLTPEERDCTCFSFFIFYFPTRLTTPATLAPITSSQTPPSSSSSRSLRRRHEATAEPIRQPLPDLLSLLHGLAWRTDGSVWLRRKSTTPCLLFPVRPHNYHIPPSASTHRPPPCTPGDTKDEDCQHWQLHAIYYPPLLRSASVKKFMVRASRCIVSHAPPSLACLFNACPPIDTYVQVGYEMHAEAQRDLTAEQAARKLRELPDVHYYKPAEDKA